MGGFLHTAFGAQQLVIGFSFNQGGFRAIADLESKRVVNLVVGPAPASFLDAALAATGLPLLAFDLGRVPPDGAVAAWMASKPLQRYIGAVFAPERRWYHLNFWLGLLVGGWLYWSYYYATDHDDPRDSYDVLFFVETTTPSVPIRT